MRPTTRANDLYAVSEPFLYGFGPPTFSTSVSLNLYYPFIWDVNGYYRELGCSVYATRVEIRKAYQRKKGWRSPRLTYILKQLLNPAIRRAYDLTPLGDAFWDQYVENSVRRAAAKRAAVLRREGRHIEAEAESNYDSPLSEEISEMSPDGLDLDGEYDYGSDSWSWSYYLWESECMDTARLSRWQSALIASLGGIHHDIAVGFVGGTDRSIVVRTVGYRLVAFLSDGAQPSKSLASEAAHQIEIHSRR